MLLLVALVIGVEMFVFERLMNNKAHRNFCVRARTRTLPRLWRRGAVNTYGPRAAAALEIQRWGVSRFRKLRFLLSDAPDG